MTDDDVSHIVPTLRPDPVDDRDLSFVPVPDAAPPPQRVSYERYQSYVCETWHQRGEECTGFALAAIANYLIRSQLDDPTEPSVSRRMLYEMAQRYDDADYVEGSTMRGALKGWRKIGVASDDLWPYEPGDEDGRVHGTLTLARVLDARRRPLLRYRRIADGSIDAMQRALADGHVLYASANTHGGWYRLYLATVDPVIVQEPHDKMAGDHAFVIAGYDEDGFWVHNSWGPEWGTEGYALLPYAQWEQYWSSVWVVDAAAEPADDDPSGEAVAPPSPHDPVASYRDMWPHLVVLGDDGRLAADGLYEMDEGSVKTLLFLFQEYTNDWAPRRLMIFADGGEWATAATIEGLRPIRDLLLAAGIYPIFVVWQTPWFGELGDEVRTSIRRRVADLGDVDTNTDVIARQAAAGSAAVRAWDKIGERSSLACRSEVGGARQLAAAVSFKRGQKPFDLHLVAHGAGDLLLAELIGLMPAPVTGATLVASAGSTALLRDVYAPMLDDGRLGQLDVLTLAADAEAEQRFGSMPGSVLSLVSDVLAVQGVHPTRSVDVSGDRWTWLPVPQPLLGLQRSLTADPQVGRLADSGKLRVATIDAVDPSRLPLRADLWERLIPSMLALHTADWTPPPPRPSELPSDPLERAAFLRDQLAGGQSA